MNQFQQKAIIEQYKSKSYYVFMDQLNNFEDLQLREISISVNSFCELPTEEKLATLTTAFKDAGAALDFITKNMKRYLQSGNADITEGELNLVALSISSLADSLRFEAETVEQVLEDELFNVAYTLEQLRLDGQLITS